jgi:Flp pilus assembly protein TadB
MVSILFVSLLAGLLAFLVGMEAITVIEPDAAGKVQAANAPSPEASRAGKKRRRFNTWLGALAGRFLPGYVRSLERDLYWSAFLVQYRRGVRTIVTSVSADDVAAVLGRQLLMSLLLGFAALFAFKANIALVAGFALGWYLTRMDLSARANSARNRISQELPEFVQLMAAESASGAALDEVIIRTADATSLVARWVKGVLSLQHGRSLLAPIGSDPDGLLHYEAMRSGQLPLAILAIQLSYASKHGVQVRPLLEGLSRGYSNDFVSSASIRAEKLGNTLGMATALFYAIPFLIAVLVVVGYPLLKVLLGG